MNNQLSLLIKESIYPHEYKAESYTGIYSMHKYWSKKPFNVIRDFILRYTSPNEIVVDPFCGSGIAISESLLSGRKGVGIDINPSALLISKQLISKLSLPSIEQEFEKLKSDISYKINSLYKIKRSGAELIATHFLWQNHTIIEIWCLESGKKIVYKPEAEDINQALSFSYDKIGFFYPKQKFFHNSRINANSKNHIYDLFTPRNLMALSLLMDRIEQIRNIGIKEFFKFCFTSSLGQASKMVFVIKSRGKFNGKFAKEKKEVGSWVIGYWIPSEHFEINAWNCFERKYQKILKAKKELSGLGFAVAPAKFPSDLLKDKNVMLINEPAQHALKQFSDNFADYVITDPPHGNRQPYLELSMMWNSWLRKRVDYQNEIVISEARERKKDTAAYYVLLEEVFREIHRILKPGKYFSLLFNSLNDDVWIRLIMVLNSMEFRLVNIETLAYSSNSVVQDTRRRGLKTDFILTYQKCPGNSPKEIEMISIKQSRDEILALISRNLGNRPQGLETYEIINIVVKDLLARNRFFKLSELLDFLMEEFKQQGNKWITGAQ